MLFNLFLALSDKSATTLLPEAVVLMYSPLLAPTTPKLKPPCLFNFCNSVAPVLPVKPTVLLKPLLTMFNCSSVAARPFLAKSGASKVTLVKPVMSPTLAFKLMLWLPATFTVWLPPNTTLPSPSLFVMDVMSVKSPSTSTLKVLTPFTSRWEAVVFLPFSMSIASLARFLITVFPPLLMLERSCLAIPVITAVSLGTSLLLPSR